MSYTINIINFSTTIIVHLGENKMRYFMVEGTITNANLINNDIMKEHIPYSQKAMDTGLIVMSSLKADMSGGLFIMKADSTEEVNNYLCNEPLKLHGIQDYKITEFDMHYFNGSLIDTIK